jgi:hypothetical protein
MLMLHEKSITRLPACLCQSARSVKALPVAQAGSLPYRRLAVGRARKWRARPNDTRPGCFLRWSHPSQTKKLATFALRQPATQFPPTKSELIRPNPTKKNDELNPRRQKGRSAGGSPACFKCPTHVAASLSSAAIFPSTSAYDNQGDSNQPATCNYPTRWRVQYPN